MGKDTVLVVLFLAELCLGIHFLNERQIETYLNNITDKFEKDPKNPRFCGVIFPPESFNGQTQGEFLLPKVLLWSPQEQYGCDIVCPVHKSSLRPWQWHTDLSGKKGKRPRLVYDLFGNIILVQRIYICIQGRISHKIQAATTDLLQMLPSSTQITFPIFLFQRSGCSKQLMRYINSEITHGVNFLTISEGIASLNHEEHTRLGLAYETARLEGLTAGQPFNFSDFYTNNIFSFPSNDQLMNLFLQQFNLDRNDYISEMNSIAGTSISCDHTFKVSRNIGVVTEGREDRFLKQFPNLYIVLNEHGEILDWRLTKSTAFSEVDDLLIKLKGRLQRLQPERENAVDMICIDDCCKNRYKYQSIFPRASVKLDLFHACQRVIKTLESKLVSKNQFAKEFGLVFRHDDDLGEQRLKITPSELKINDNIDKLLKRWKSVPGTCVTQETLKQINNLREHINKGCLSGIPPGRGTTKNEQLHRLLNRSLLTGATRITIELAVALLTVLFYHHSKTVSSNLRHSCNSRVQCIPPIRRNVNKSKDSRTGVAEWSPFKTQNSEINRLASNNNESTEANEQLIDQNDDVVVVAEKIEDVCSETVAQGIFNAAVSNDSILTNFNKGKFNRSFNSADLFLLTNTRGLTMQHASNVEIENDSSDPTVRDHLNSLSRNLLGFHREVDEIPRDGDCAFRSIARMLNVSCNDDQRDLQSHLRNIGLLKSVDEDTITIRQRFVEEILKGDNEILAFFPTQDRNAITHTAHMFRRRGVFDTALGDFVMRVCAELLRVPIMVVTSLESLQYIPFFPSCPLSSTFIYVAYHYYGAGHYDATKPKELDSTENDQNDEKATDRRGCSCGSKIKSREKFACEVNSWGQTSRCPCVKRGEQCSPDVCKCRNCGNLETKISEQVKTYCRCGESQKKRNANSISCTDSKGRNRTKCPCFVNGVGCKDCHCYNCKNDYGTNQLKIDKAIGKRKSDLSSPPSLKRQRGSQFLRENNVNNLSGSWSQLEGCILDMTESFLFSTCILPSKMNIHTLYNYVIQSSSGKKCDIKFSKKSLAQVSGKLDHKRKRLEAILSLISDGQNSEEN